jgi:RecA-family ATPase
MQAEQIAKALGNAKRVGKGWLASCPLPTHGQGHGDKNPSLSISDGEDGKPLFKCHSGCDQHELFHAIRDYGLLPEIEKRDPLASIKPLPALQATVLEHEWVYVDEDGEPLFVKQRFKTHSAKGKDYRQARINKDGSRSYSLGDCRIVPYRFPELLNAKTAGRAIYLVEGEKAADALVEIGAIATSAHAGSGSWPQEITQYFAGATVVMLPDNDLAGWKYAKLVAAALIPVVKSLRIVDLPVIYPTDDAWEWVHVYGGTRQQLAELAKQAQPITSADDVTYPVGLLAASEVAAPATPNATTETNPGNVHQETDKTYKPFKIESWQSVKDEPVNWLVQDVIPEKSFVALYGPPASFKSFIAMDIAECIASGRPWLGKEILGTGPVLYIAGEGHGGIGARIAAIKQHHKTPDSSQLYVVRSMINLRSSVDDFTNLILAIDELVQLIGVQLRMIVIDTLARAFGGGNENSSDDMGAFIQATGKIQNRYKCSLMLLHHAGKDTTKGLRGHSSLLGAVDTQMEIIRFPQTREGLILMSKQKDGEDGQNYGFEAIEVEIDRSELGLENGSSLAIKHRETISGEMEKARKGQETKEPPDVTDKGIFASYALKALFMAMTTKSRRVPAINDQLVVTREDWKEAVNELRRRNDQEALSKRQGDDGARTFGEKLVARGIGGTYDTKEVIFVWLNQATMLKLQADPGFGGGEEHFPQKEV